MSDVRTDILDGYSLRERTALASGGVGLALATGLMAMPEAIGRGALVALALYAVVAAAACGRIGAYHPHARFGLANAITLVRAAGTALLAGALAVPGLLARPDAGWLVLFAAVGLLALDGLDGWAARRQRLSSRFGARFDMEVDTLLLLVLAAYAVALDKAGVWVLAVGLLRYVFVAGGYAVPALRRDLPASLRRKAVCVLQTAVLAAMLAPPVVRPVAPALAALALAALACSFGRDVVWLLRRAE